MRTHLSLGVTVMTHAKRAELAAELADELDKQAGMARTHIVCDPQPDGMPCALRTAVVAWRRAEHTHELVLQDDALVPEWLLDAAELVARKHPTRIICLYHGGGPIAASVPLNACAAEGGGVTLLPRVATFVPTVATIYPAHIARDLAVYAEHTGALRRRLADDALVASYARANRVDVCATVPSFVDHDWTVASIVQAGGLPNRHTRIRAALHAPTTDRPEWLAND